MKSILSAVLLTCACATTQTAAHRDVQWPRDDELLEVGAALTGVEADAVHLVETMLTSPTLANAFESQEVACFRQPAAQQFWVRQKGDLVFVLHRLTGAPCIEGGLHRPDVEYAVDPALGQVVGKKVIQ